MHFEYFALECKGKLFPKQWPGSIVCREPSWILLLSQFKSSEQTVALQARDHESSERFKLCLPWWGPSRKQHLEILPPSPWRRWANLPQHGVISLQRKGQIHRTAVKTSENKQKTQSPNVRVPLLWCNPLYSQVNTWPLSVHPVGMGTQEARRVITLASAFCHKWHTASSSDLSGLLLVCGRKSWLDDSLAHKQGKLSDPLLFQT